MRTRGSRSENNNQFPYKKVVTHREHFLSVSKRGLSNLRKETGGRCSPWRARCTGRGRPRSGIAGGSASQSEPGKERIQNWKNAKWLSEDLGGGDGDHVPHANHPLHAVGQLLDDLDAVQALAGNILFKKRLNKGMRLQPGRNVSEGEADVEVRVPEGKAVAERQALFIV